MSILTSDIISNILKFANNDTLKICCFVNKEFNLYTQHEFYNRKGFAYNYTCNEVTYCCNLRIVKNLIVGNLLHGERWLASDNIKYYLSGKNVGRCATLVEMFSDDLPGPYD